MSEASWPSACSWHASILPRHLWRSGGALALLHAPGLFWEAAEQHFSGRDWRTYPLCRTSFQSEPTPAPVQLVFTTCTFHVLSSLHTTTSLPSVPSKSSDAQEAPPGDRLEHNQLQADVFNRKSDSVHEPQPEEVEEVCCSTWLSHPCCLHLKTVLLHSLWWLSPLTGLPAGTLRCCTSRVIDVMVCVQMP